jgi:hypothetical protein
MADGRIPPEDSQGTHEGGKQDGDQDRAHRSVARLKVV